MFPAGKLRYATEQFPDEVPEALRRAFSSAASAFNSSNYVATAVCARRTLEGIFKYRLPESDRKGTLAQLIDRTMNSIDLAAPLASLSHAIRDGGNLGAHFDSDREPTEELARQMVELLNYLISYLYVLPKEIQKLEASLESEPLSSAPGDLPAT